MHSMNLECGILIDMLRCDGEKGMAKLKNMKGAVVPLHAFMYVYCTRGLVPHVVSFIS